MHYQGKIPPHVSKKIRLQKQKLQEKEYELKQFEEEAPPRQHAARRIRLHF